MKIHQEGLPFNEAGANSKQRAGISWKGYVGDWFYVEPLNRPHECLYADDRGNYYYDQKQFSFVVPVVWNLRKEAQRVARKQKGRVRKFPYRLKKI